MEKMEMLNFYNSLSAAKGYILGFIHSHKVYYVNCEHINPDLLTIEAASRNQGDNLRLRIRKPHREMLINSATYLCEETDLISTTHNKGENFERAVFAHYRQEWKKDNIPFWVQGDINITGIETQIKLDGATLINSKTLGKLHNMVR